MPAKLYRVDLTQSEREQLLDIARKGKTSARKVKRSPAGTGCAMGFAKWK